MLGRAQLRTMGAETPQASGYRPLSGRRRVTDATAGNLNIPVAALLGGWLDRSGPGAGYADVFPSADAILSAVPELSLGDSFEFWVTSSVAFTNTPTVGVGITLAGTTTVTANSTRTYLATVLSENRRARIIPGSSTNASPILTALAIEELKNVGMGMLVTGTNIPAATSVIAINYNLGTVTLSANATGTASLTAFTFTPQIEIRGVSSGAQ